ncbi:F-box/kelch-repeat protein At3g06240-like [Rhododendron vialii]|uniref:F-box/kelch-repeat protein At3g06240-like n=1 Tax=Rhododendron vialii TaxID=182163 RepID=UPI00265DCF89|nr:F-box/kelch-repeat protein At3g06240-like [Rhododendron vialii]
MSDGGALPQEIITVILSRLPFKSLSRFKCVSPSWKTLISSPHFAQTRLNRTKATHRPRKAILFTSSFDLYSLDFSDANLTPERLDHPPFNHMSVDSRSVSSCNGLVLVSDEGFVNFLFNPSTSEWKELPSAFPSPFPQYSSVDVFYPPGLGYVSYPVDYKVVMPFFKQRRNANDADTTIVAVYSLKNNAWRTIQDFPYDPVGRGRGVCFNEHLHLLCGRTGGLDYSEVVAFDLADEIFREVELPASYDDTEYRGHDMVVLEGCLCLLVWSKSD